MVRIGDQNSCAVVHIVWTEPSPHKTGSSHVAGIVEERQARVIGRIWRPIENRVEKRAAQMTCNLQSVSSMAQKTTLQRSSRDYHEMRPMEVASGCSSACEAVKRWVGSKQTVRCKKSIPTGELMGMICSQGCDGKSLKRTLFQSGYD